MIRIEEVEIACDLTDLYFDDWKLCRFGPCSRALPQYILQQQACGRRSKEEAMMHAQVFKAQHES
jgi:hypothetical protein